MSDTIQGVSWALERPCPFRGGERWEKPEVTATQLGRLRCFSDALADGRVFDGVCVTSHYRGSDASGQSVAIPSGGFRMTEAFSGRGQPDEVAATCGACEANVSGGRPRPGVAGCHGFLYLPPWSVELDQALWRLIEEQRLAGRLERCFSVTTPLWYGFWINSPLRRPQCELLWELLSRTRDTGIDLRRQRSEGLTDFLAALRAAVREDLPLHVSMAPPGHVDLGWYTVFAHCPRCKAEADLPRWTGKTPSEPYTCAACGIIYDPSKTTSSERDNFDDSDRLEKILAEEYDPFVYAYARSRGHTEAQVAEALDRHRGGPFKRQIAAARKQVGEIEARYTFPPVPEEQWGRLPEALALELGGGAVLELQLIPAGEFLMGSTETEQEQPVHGVRIARPLYVGKYPVTEAQWRAVTGEPSDEKQRPGDLQAKGDPRRAVDGQTWLNAQAFCTKLSERVGRHLRLPSEAEWEYACRAGSRTAFAWGEELTPAQACFREECSDLNVLLSSPRRGPAPVGQFPPNAWALHDMHGNVAEWCEDTCHENYQGAPADGSAWVGAEDQAIDRVTRGGSANTRAAVCRSAARWCRGGVSDGHGVRVVCAPRAADLMPADE